MFDNACFWYDEEREEHDRYLAECEVKEAYNEFEELGYAIEEYDLTDEQFDKLPDDTFPEEGRLTYMDCDELQAILDRVNACISIFYDILAELTNH